MPNPVSRPIFPAGSASRRCLLSAQGVAYWGLPSFARCISHEYRYLYLSVSVPRGSGVGGTGSVPGSGGGVEGACLLLWPMCLGRHMLSGCTSAWLCPSLPSTLLLTS